MLKNFFFYYRGSSSKQIAILHPKLFSVYSFRKKETEDKKVPDGVNLDLVYQHVLRHAAHSFVLGYFGGVRGRHFVCIQSLDGTISFYEQETFAFQVYLSDFLLPFPFIYLDKTDSFLFFNGYLTFTCYSYESLACSTNEKKLMKSWEYSLGEGIIDIQTAVKDRLIIVVLSERNFYGLNENGNLVFSKRLDYKPVAFCTYPTENGRTLMVLIATDGKFINLYEETEIKWAMKIDHTPVCMKRIFLNGLPGGLALLTENGFLQCVYVGTRPSIYIVPPVFETEIDRIKAESELKSLHKKIKENDMVDPTFTDPLCVNINVGKWNEKQEKDVKYCNIIVEVITQCSISKLQILILLPEPLVAQPQSILTDIPSEKTVMESTVFLSECGLISSLSFQVVVSYLIEGGIRYVRKNGVFPLQLVALEAQPEKEAEQKITISSNRPTLNLNQLFTEFVISDSSTNSVGLKLLSSRNTITIVSAKSSQRYRLQAESLAEMTVPFSVLIDKLKYQYHKDKNFKLFYTGSLPLEQFFEKIQHYRKILNNKEVMERNLSKETGQYRILQKTVFSNLKDGSPTPLSNHAKMVQQTFASVLSSISKIENLEKEIIISRCEISSLSRLLLALMELMPIPEENQKLLRTVLFPFIYDTETQVNFFKNNCFNSKIIQILFLNDVMKMP